MCEHAEVGKTKALNGAQCFFGDQIQTQNLNFYNIIKEIIQTEKYLCFP